MDEFREVAPIPGLGSVVPAKHPANKLAPPPAGSRKISMNASFRARRLKEIKADNADVVDRIRKSVSHYRNDDLQREWQQNLSYLSSISEFPVSVDSLTSPKLGHKHHNAGDDTRSCFGPSPRRSSFLKPSPRAETLPSIPVVAHPIKSIPTSPKKLQLNMSPAFRSLRKAMPQHPSLPPISSPHSVLNAGGASDFSSGVNNTLLPSPSGRNSCPNSPRDEDFTENRMGRGLPYRSSTAIAATKFIGDLHGKQAENEVSGDAKYQLLKTGRFVGGTYLVLTVFCGDGVANPYGFDVFAYHRELKCEYKLSITKEMTHELLDKSSSSSLAAETAAAAGTNLSMQEIARNICDHINFALLGTDQGEMIFLTPSVERKSEQAMRDKVDAEVDSPEEHAREFPQGRTSWEEENISEGDESADSEVYDEDRMEEAAGLGSGIVPYDTDEEEEREEADASYSSYANQDDDLDVMVESFEDVKPHSGQEETLNRGDGFLALHEDVPDSKKEDSERSTRRSWRQGQKLDGRFCLLQGSSDDSGLAVRIAALGQLEMLPTSSVYRAI
ncbi:uncharacterized protein KRP23_6896 [Phytophthora ramorum]|uniref:uncharacterized protein n=1 Tax=Phytophthora ramorum TaxID=164328 RepID=UPI00309EF773|nr:hypothetical protein KRP23_6896 [Phytophthora ramorum]